MAYKLTRVEMWTGEIEDRLGGLNARLDVVADAGANLQIVVARRQAHLPGKGVVFLGPIKGARAQRAAIAAGLSRATDLHALRVEAANKPGDCARVTRILAEARISLRALTATVCGAKYVLTLAFDTAEAAAEATRLLRASGSKRRKIVTAPVAK